MDSVNDLQNQVQALMKQYLSPGLLSPTIETQLIIDREGHHYQLIHMGWDNGQRVYTCVLHIDIKGDKVWIQHNMTDQAVAEDMVALGVPPNHIILGFHSPATRQFTGFAVN